MAFSLLPKHKSLVFSTPIYHHILLLFRKGCAEDNPVQMFDKALTSFNNKFVCDGCTDVYRLDQSGSINLPPQAIDLFCNGPCLAETKLVLNCVDNIFSNFLFYNRATARDIRGAINFVCPYNRQRGYAQGEISNVERLKSSIVFNVLLVITGCCYFTLS